MKLFFIVVGILLLTIDTFSIIRRFRKPSPLEVAQYDARIWWKLGAARIILIILGAILVIVGIII